MSWLFTWFLAVTGLAWVAVWLIDRDLARQDARRELRREQDRPLRLVRLEAQHG